MATACMRTCGRVRGYESHPHDRIAQLQSAPLFSIFYSRATAAARATVPATTHRRIRFSAWVVDICVEPKQPGGDGATAVLVWKGTVAGLRRREDRGIVED